MFPNESKLSVYGIKTMLFIRILSMCISNTPHNTKLHSEYQLVGTTVHTNQYASCSKLLKCEGGISSNIEWLYWSACNIHIPDPEDSFHKRCCIYPVLVWAFCMWQESLAAPSRPPVCVHTSNVLTFHQDCPVSRHPSWVFHSVTLGLVLGFVIKCFCKDKSKQLALKGRHLTEWG